MFTSEIDKRKGIATFILLRMGWSDGKKIN